MNIIDISRKLTPQLAVWPGDTAFELKTVLDKRQGSSVNLTTITISAHTGTHVDAPRHFMNDGESLEQLDLEPFWGKAQVVSVQKEWGELTPEDFSHANLYLAPRLLVHSHSSQRNPNLFDTEIVYPSPELAEHLGSIGIILYGTDAPSVDELSSKSLPGHHALYKNKIAILEGLDLSRVADGLYELVALPLNIQGGDGSPVRAVLRPLEEP